jgi:hypothetical protein
MGLHGQERATLAVVALDRLRRDAPATGH